MTRRLAVLFALLAVGPLGNALAAEPAAAATVLMCSAGDPTPNDLDDDCVSDDRDNCYGVPNPDQRNSDNDPAGDACDGDDDNDGVLDGDDNCRTEHNPDQTNTTGTRYGNACYKDTDGDGHIDEEDNCKRDSNPDQMDLDRDGTGDLCDADDDQDGALDRSDNCPRNVNKDQSDADGDGVGNLCDPDFFAGSSFVAPPPAAGQPAKAADRTAARVTLKLASTQRGSDALGGMPAKVRCSEACAVSAQLKLGSAVAMRLKLKTVVATGEAALDGAGTTYVFLDFTKPALKKLFRSKVSATLTLKVLDAAGNASSARRSVRLAK